MEEPRWTPRVASSCCSWSASCSPPCSAAVPSDRRNRPRRRGVGRQRRPQPHPARPDHAIYLVVDGDHSATLATVRQAAFQAVVAAAYRHKAAVILATAGAGPGNMRIVFSALAVAEGANGETSGA